MARPTAWGNPFRVGDRFDRPDARAKFRQWLIDPQQLASEDLHGMEPDKRVWMLDNLWRLRGKDLCCWCPLDAACHSDVLLEVANASSILYGARIVMQFQANNVVDLDTLVDFYGPDDHETVVGLLQRWIEDDEFDPSELLDFGESDLLKIVPTIQEIKP